MRQVYRGAAALLLNTTVALLLVEGLAAGVLAIDHGVRRPTVAEAFYATQPWGAAYVQESRHLAEQAAPHVGWQLAPLTGSYINVETSGLRATPGARCEKGAFTVFVLGGSAVMGEGVPDEFTVPAVLQRAIAARTSRPVCVRNLGSPAWVSTQSVISLLRRLQAGDRPDLVIVHDGYNDAVTAGEGLPAGDSLPVVVSEAPSDMDRIGASFLRLVQATHLYAIVQRATQKAQALFSAGTSGPDAPVDLAAATRAYETNADTIRALGERFGFRYAFFWQPTLWVKAGTLTPEEERARKEASAKPVNVEAVRTMYARMREEVARHDRQFYLGDLFDGVPGVFYLDEAHLTPDGNARVAARIIDAVAGDLPGR